MGSNEERSAGKPERNEVLEELIRSTPARIGVGRAGTRPLTSTLLTLRLDHAAAVDSVYGEVRPELLDKLNLFSVTTMCRDKEMYLKRPDLGRRLTPESEARLAAACMAKPQVQIVVSGGLSAEAIEANIEDVYPSLLDSLRSYKLTWGTSFFVTNGRVACMDHIGELLEPEVLVMLIGERPGLASPQSMSAYLCYRPHIGTVESDRNVLSNIHRNGTQPIEAGAHIGTVVKAMIEQGTSGMNLRM
ncbi:ethanolamine ammonia-lyase subunit EutC [Paenibacillus solisilvae]|uniref:Ethanolamine ammonia-lyase small subunit n=1 Tax=Paenibacillus solisilvae TaxID=2486751 RepID=A0ABW0VUP5_9BACL